MKFIIKQTTGIEVLDEGGWKVDLVCLEDYLNEKLENEKFGQSIDTFYYGFELFDFQGQFVDFLGKIKGYSSYRPKLKGVVINDQIDFRYVINLDQQAQLQIVMESILDSIARVGDMKRKPKEFDYQGFQKVVNDALDSYNANLGRA